MTEARLRGELSLAEGNALSIILLKISRIKRALRNHHRLMRLHERELLPAVNEWMSTMIKELQAGLPKMRGRTPAAKARSVADWNKLREQGEAIMRPALFTVLVAGGNSVMGQRIQKQERFDPIGIEAVAWTTEHSAALVVEVTEKTMLAIREYITAGIQAGKSTQAIAMELRPLVGLTERQIMSVANYHEMLILERPEYTVATQRKMAEVYARRLHRQRAQMIAQTETAYALTEGQRQGYNQMGIKKLQRIEDPVGPDDECRTYNGRIYTIAEAAGVLPAHPRCEGSWIAAL